MSDRSNAINPTDSFSEVLGVLPIEYEPFQRLTEQTVETVSGCANKPHTSLKESVGEFVSVVLSAISVPLW